MELASIDTGSKPEAADRWRSKSTPSYNTSLYLAFQQSLCRVKMHVETDMGMIHAMIMEAAVDSRIPSSEAVAPPLDLGHLQDGNEPPAAEVGRSSASDHVSPIAADPREGRTCRVPGSPDYPLCEVSHAELGRAHRKSPAPR